MCLLVWVCERRLCLTCRALPFGTPALSHLVHVVLRAGRRRCPGVGRDRAGSKRSSGSFVGPGQRRESEGIGFSASACMGLVWLWILRDGSRFFFSDASWIMGTLISFPFRRNFAEPQSGSTSLPLHPRQVPSADVSVAAPGVSGDVDVAGSMPSVSGSTPSVETSASLPKAEGVDVVAPPFCLTSFMMRIGLVMFLIYLTSALFSQKTVEGGGHNAGL